MFVVVQARGVVPIATERVNCVQALFIFALASSYDVSQTCRAAWTRGLPKKLAALYASCQSSSVLLDCLLCGQLSRAPSAWSVSLLCACSCWCGERLRCLRGFGFCPSSTCLGSAVYSLCLMFSIWCVWHPVRLVTTS